MYMFKLINKFEKCFFFGYTNNIFILLIKSKYYENTYY